ncbi:MAG: DUF493 family protein [Brumimicrobium sp.]
MPKRFESLKTQLEQQEWPNVYLFKFIVPSDNQTIAKVASMFEETADIQIRASSGGNYTSISVKEIMMNAESIIEKYIHASKIKGVITI